MNTTFKHTPIEARKLWVEALRSGEYPQVSGALCEVDGDDEHAAVIGYCCLGVGCELFLKHEHDIHTHVNTCKEREYCDESGVLPPVVRNWLGLRSTDGTFKNGDTGNSDSLVERNDNGAQFDAIADIIESAPPGLFVEATV